jgi:hypothetical protein
LRSTVTLRQRRFSGLGLGLTGMLILLAALITPAQNLGLGTGSRNAKSSDSTENKPSSDRLEDASPRKSQMGKRLGLLGRKGNVFDPKLFEARGRELQGQFYEIGGVAKTTVSPNSATTKTEIYSTKPQNQSRAWIYWVGAAGVVGVSAGVASLIMLNNAHPTAPPQYIDLSDQP